MIPGGLMRPILVLGLGLVLLAGCASDRGLDRQAAARANANVGAEYLHRNENDRAAQAFKRALDYDASNFTANWGMAVVSDRLQDPGKARQYFEKTLAVRHSPVIYNSYAAFLCRQGDAAAGIENFRKALASPNTADRADSLANAGLCLQRNGQSDAAVDYYQQALAVDARQATALTQMADIAYHTQDYMKARAFIERADAATTLDGKQLRLAARIESALGDRAAAEAYMKRDHANPPGAKPSPGQLESARQ